DPFRVTYPVVRRVPCPFILVLRRPSTNNSVASFLISLSPFFIPRKNYVSVRNVLLSAPCANLLFIGFVPSLVPLIVNRTLFRVQLSFRLILRHARPTPNHQAVFAFCSFCES